jgi:hypothetical protein
MACTINVLRRVMIDIYNCNDSGLYYKHVMIVIYNRSDSGLYHKHVTILICNCSDSGLYYKCFKIIIYNCNDRGLCYKHVTIIIYTSSSIAFGWSAFSSKRQFVKTPFHRIPLGVAFHRMPFRGGHSSKKCTHNSAIFNERAPSGFSPNALVSGFLSNLHKVRPFTESTVK